jgi:DNA-binding transcriptional regulator YdaS (Cro superfamily)
MAKKKELIEEPAVEQAVNGLKEMNAEEAAPVASPVVEEVAPEAPVAEEIDPNQIGLRTRAYRG